MSQLILQPFFRFFYVTGFSLTSTGEPPMPYLGIELVDEDKPWTPHKVVLFYNYQNLQLLDILLKIFMNVLIT